MPHFLPDYGDIIVLFDQLCTPTAYVSECFVLHVLNRPASCVLDIADIALQGKIGANV